MLVLIWVQIVGKGYQQMTKVISSKERVQALENVQCLSFSESRLMLMGLLYFSL